MSNKESEEWREKIIDALLFSTPEQIEDSFRLPQRARDILDEWPGLLGITARADALGEYDGSKALAALILSYDVDNWDDWERVKRSILSPLEELEARIKDAGLCD